MSEQEVWVCQCRRCLGVFTAADAVQYVWEFALGACGVPVVVGVHTLDDGFVRCAWVYWHDEPDDPQPINGLFEFIVSCRPGEGTMQTEGDIARWARWTKAAHPPRDWLLVDGLRFRSVRELAEALHQRARLPDEQTIPGDWWSIDATDQAQRNEIRTGWTETKRRNQAFWKT